MRYAITRRRVSAGGSNINAVGSIRNHQDIISRNKHRCRWLLAKELQTPFNDEIPDVF
jgi:hypothetical protein